MGPSVAAAKVLLSVGNPYFREARAQNGHGFDPMRSVIPCSVHSSLCSHLESRGATVLTCVILYK